LNKANNNIINDIIFFGPTTKLSKHSIIIVININQPGQVDVSSPPEMRVKGIRRGARKHLITVVVIVVAGQSCVIVVLVVLLPFFARPTVLFGFPIIVTAVTTIVIVIA